MTLGAIKLIRFYSVSYIGKVMMRINEARDSQYNQQLVNMCNFA